MRGLWSSIALEGRKQIKFLPVSFIAGGVKGKEKTKESMFPFKYGAQNLHEPLRNTAVL